MMDETVGNPNVEPGTRAARNSAATIEHTEITLDEKPPVISTGSGDPGVKYQTNQAGQTAVVIQTKPDPSEKPKDFVVTSCFVIMLCNFCLGLPGWHYGTKANWAWQLGDVMEARRQAKRAKLFVICGVIVGIITWVLALTLFFTVSPFRP